LTLSIGDKEFSEEISPFQEKLFSCCLLAGARIRADFSVLSLGLDKISRNFREEERNMAMAGNELGHTAGFLPSLLYLILGVHPN